MWFRGRGLVARLGVTALSLSLLISRKRTWPGDPPVSSLIFDLCSTLLTPWGPVEYVITGSPDSVTGIQGTYLLS